MTPNEATLAWMRTRADASLAIASTAGSKLGTWLLVGNAAALVLVLKAATDGAVCEGFFRHLRHGSQQDCSLRSPAGPCLTSHPLPVCA